MEERELLASFGDQAALALDRAQALIDREDLSSAASWWRARRPGCASQGPAWTACSIRTLRDRVSDLRPVYLPPDPASRTTYRPGELAQCDFWFPEVQIPVGFGQVRTPKKLPVLVMVLSLIHI